MDAGTQRAEALGPAERIIATITQYVDHMVHNRPGVVIQDGRNKVGVRWEAATWKLEGDEKIVSLVRKVGKKQIKTRLGVGVKGTDEVREGGRVVAHFRQPGMFPEVVAFLYERVSEIWKLDNEFAAKWASWAYANEDNRDMKVLLAAFMLVQSRFGEPIKDGDETFQDEDYRAVGEAMCLLRGRKKGQTFNPKLLLRIGEVLELPQVVALNRKLQFGQSQRSAIIGRYYKVLSKWLGNMDQNPKILEKLVEGGFRTSIMAVARKVGFKPATDKFFEILRWKQVQSKDGRRTVAVGKAVKAADTWDELSEKEICEKIVGGKMSYKIIAGKLPATVGLTPAIMSAAIEAGSLSDNDLIIMTPTLEELGLLEEGDIKVRWKAAMDQAENQRAANIARSVKSVEVKEELEAAADKATAKAVEEVTRDLRIYVMVDKSSSMQGALERAKEYCTKFVGAFPLDRLHVSVFNTVGSEVKITRPSAAGVAAAFRGHKAGGGTTYAAGISCLLENHKPAENEDALFIWVGDQEDRGSPALTHIIRSSGVMPVAFGLLHVKGDWGGTWGNIVETTAVALGIPCFKIDEGIFADPYAVPRTIRNLIAATPVGKQVTTAAPKRRVSLINTILKTPLLQKPMWA